MFSMKYGHYEFLVFISVNIYRTPIISMDVSITHMFSVNIRITL